MPDAIACNGKFSRQLQYTALANSQVTGPNLNACNLLLPPTRCYAIVAHPNNHWNGAAPYCPPEQPLECCCALLPTPRALASCLPACVGPKQPPERL